MYIIRGDYDLNKRKPRIQVIFADDYLEYNPGDFWTDIKTTGLDNEGAGVAFKNSKKPEQLIERICKLSSNENDLVLDSFLGSRVIIMTVANSTVKSRVLKLKN